MIIQSSGVICLKKFLVVILLSLTLVGCSYGGVANHDPDTLQVIFLSTIPVSYDEALEDYIRDILSEEVKEGLDVEVTLTMPNFDRLTIEIFNREADMIIVEGWLIPPLLDPLGLVPLDQFYDDVDPAVRSTYMTENEEGTDEHLFLIPLNEGSGFHEYTGFIFEEGLAAGVVSSTPHKEAALKILEEWL